MLILNKISRSTCLAVVVQRMTFSESLKTMKTSRWSLVIQVQLTLVKLSPVNLKSGSYGIASSLLRLKIVRTWKLWEWHPKTLANGGRLLRISK